MAIPIDPYGTTTVLTSNFGFIGIFKALQPAKKSIGIKHCYCKQQGPKIATLINLLFLSIKYINITHC